MYVMLFHTSRLLAGDTRNIALGVFFLAAGLCSFAALKLREKRRDKK